MPDTVLRIRGYGIALLLVSCTCAIVFRTCQVFTALLRVLRFLCAVQLITRYMYIEGVGSQLVLSSHDTSVLTVGMQNRLRRQYPGGGIPQGYAQ